LEEIYSYSLNEWSVTEKVSAKCFWLHHVVTTYTDKILSYRRETALQGAL